MGSRKKRTELFESDIFRSRRSPSCWNHLEICDFKHKVLDEVRRNIISNLGYRISAIEWEETLLYSMASCSDLFGTAISKYNEKQFVKKFLKVIEIPL
jgi:hypothetical protein